MTVDHETTHPGSAASIRAAERIYEAWDEALGRKDLDASMSLYAPDATLESPLVRHLLGTETGVIQGREKLRTFVEKVYERTPELRTRYRRGFFTDGTVVMWEYPRRTPDGEQMDFVETMELKDGLIQHHRVYWGWFGGKVLEEDAYRREPD
jgi:SnoaL-like protein